MLLSLKHKAIPADLGWPDGRGGGIALASLTLSPLA